MQWFCSRSKRNKRSRKKRWRRIAVLVIISTSSFSPTFMKLSLNSQDLIAFKLCANLAKIDSHCIQEAMGDCVAWSVWKVPRVMRIWTSYCPGLMDARQWWWCCKLWWQGWVTRAWILYMYNVQGPSCRIYGYKVVTIIYLRNGSLLVMSMLEKVSL